MKWDDCFVSTWVDTVCYNKTGLLLTVYYVVGCLAATLSCLW